MASTTVDSTPDALHQLTQTLKSWRSEAEPAGTTCTNGPGPSVSFSSLLVRPSNHLDEILTTGNTSTSCSFGDALTGS